MGIPICLKCGGDEMICRVRRDCVDRGWLQYDGVIEFKRHDQEDYEIRELRCRACGEVLRDEKGEPITSEKMLLEFYKRHERELARAAGDCSL